jgi:alkylresorcinol/alkylpyrone synthase/polyketide synthase Type III
MNHHKPETKLSQPEVLAGTNLRDPVNISPAILAVGTANPPRRYSQEEIYNLARRSSAFYRSDRVKQIFMNSGIDHRHFCFDIETFNPNENSDELHARFATGSVALSAEAINACLASGGFSISDIDYIVAVSCTGYLCPGLSSILIKELGMRRNIQRADLLGMGCAGAMPGLQRAYDFVKAYPDKRALLITVEICSACYYIDDSLETVVGNAICADGAAAVVVGMDGSGPVPRISEFISFLEPSLIDKVGFEHRDGKLRIILSKDIRDIAGKLAKQVVTDLLRNTGVRKNQIRHWILHSGGRKVIDNLQEELELSKEEIRHSECVLKQFGNMSSPTVLFVLQETMRQSSPQEGDLGVMLAMGPGLALEAALLRW